MTRRLRTPLLLLSLLTVAVLALAACTTQTEVVNPEQRSQIAVTGRGEVQADPDTVILSLGVSVLRDSVQDALQDAADSMAEVLRTLEDVGVEEEDVQTTNFAVFPEFNFDREGGRDLLGFRVTNQVTVKLRDVDAAGELIDAAAEAGGDDVLINGISFTVDDPDDLLDEARELAVADARAKAEQLASLAGVELGDVIAISESGGGSPRFEAFGGDVLASVVEAAPTPVAPGQTTVALSVSVVFELR